MTHVPVVVARSIKNAVENNYKNSKSQAPNDKQITIYKSQIKNLEYLEFGYWNLVIVWNL
jgi:hypothetical protein